MHLLWAFFEELFLSKLIFFRAHVLFLERCAEHRITLLLKCYAKKDTVLKWMSGPLAAYCKTIQRSLLTSRLYSVNRLFRDHSRTDVLENNYSRNPQENDHI